MDPHFLLYAVISCSLIFTYTNGFQDGSAVAATAIASRALTPFQTVALVATAEFLGALFGGSAVASAIHSVTSYPSRPQLLPVLLSALLAAIFWNLLTRRLKIPSSSTHALFGGILGAVIAESHDFRYIVWGAPNGLVNASGWCKVLLSLFVSPILGFAAGFVLIVILVIAFMKTNLRAAKVADALQLVSLSLLSFGHGANDTQKAMGLIVLALNAAGDTAQSGIPFWVRLLTGLFMALGILSFAPGIVRRVGIGIFRIKTLEALAAQGAAALVVVCGSLTGGPISASQVISSSVFGVGAAEGRKRVHWLVARDLVAAWVFTIPGAGTMAWLLHAGLVHWLKYLMRT